MSVTLNVTLRFPWEGSLKTSAARYAVGQHNYTPTVVPDLSGSRGGSGSEGDVAWNVTLPAQRHIVSN